MKEKMSRWGVGPVFASFSIGYGIIMLVISNYFRPVFQINFVPYWLLAVVGIFLIMIGVPFFLLSVKTAMRAYNADELVTEGVFSCCRHPLYASWVVFLVPGAILLANSWIGLTTPIFMYFILRNLVKKEETYLEEVFGPEYLDYTRRVPCILPYGLLKKNV
jgi:protein-S-isoprenylcysteine O-methyltransferase Ste14